MLEDVLERLGGLEPDDPMFLLHAAAAAEDVDAALGDPLTLQEVADRIREVAVDVGANSVCGASDVGNRLAAAAAARGAGLPLFTDATPGGSVLVVDSVLITGYQVKVTAESARRMGASAIFGCVLATAPGASEIDSLDGFSSVM